MVLNHASLRASDQHTVVNYLKDVAVGMSTLVRDGVVQKLLRMSQSIYETHCHADWSLFDACQELQRSGARDEYVFFMSLSAKVPLLSDAGCDVADRFLACEAKTLPPGDGEPLVLCAITDGIAVGFPSDPIWDRDQLAVDFDELMLDESLIEASEMVDNLTRSVHALPICERHRADIRQFNDFAELWRTRKEAFPNLAFGPDVERQVQVLNPAVLSAVVKRLASLDESSGEWSVTGGAIPSWKCNVTPESGSVMNNAALREARRFKSHRGSRELFEWHARFGGGGRIHLRFDSHAREVEIGYIGQHLPLPR
jgi:hypothetical protein